MIKVTVFSSAPTVLVDDGSTIVLGSMLLTALAAIDFKEVLGNKRKGIERREDELSDGRKLLSLPNVGRCLLTFTRANNRRADSSLIP